MKVTHDNAALPKFVPVTFTVTADTLEELKALRALYGGFSLPIAERISEGASMCRVSANDVEKVAGTIGRAAQHVLVQRGEF